MLPNSSTILLVGLLTKVAQGLAFVTPELKPSDVVQRQLDALKARDVYTVFKYASPNNKANTGPWQRFGKMLEAPPYDVLLGHEKSLILMEMNEEIDRTQQYTCLVRIWPSHEYVGKTPGTQDFVWLLGKVKQEPFVDCWMTDGVILSSYM